MVMSGYSVSSRLGVRGSILVLQLAGFCFFFSSRRRHTRFDCDWSSDVCSSDLKCESVSAGHVGIAAKSAQFAVGDADVRRIDMAIYVEVGDVAVALLTNVIKIGRASCRERV